jgi:hypothetical protein
VIRKAKAKEARTKAASIQSVQKPAVIALPASSEESATECEETLEVVRSDEPTPRFLSLIPNIEDQATAFFVSNYAVSKACVLHPINLMAGLHTSLLRKRC